jgi:HEAT repeat protein
VTSVTRWKLVSLVLAGCMSYSWCHGDAASTPSSTAPAKRFSGPLRVNAAALGISTEELVRRMFAAKQASDLEELAQRFGIVGDNAAIELVLPLVHDSKCPAPEAIVRAFGAIGTDRAIDVLLELARDRNEDLQLAAIDALGATKNRRAEATLIEIVTANESDAQYRAIYALGQVAGERGIEVLAQLAARSEQNGVYAIRALGTIEDPRARAAIVALVDSPSLRVAANAIGELTEENLDDAMIAKLAGIVERAESDLVAPALGALAKTAAGRPLVRAAALDGVADTRLAAIEVLGELDDPEIVATMRTILESEEGRLADKAADVLATIDSEEAREALISAALADEHGESSALEALLKQKGPDVEQALLVIAKSESRNRWDAVEALVKDGNEEATQLAIAHARSSDPDTRTEALDALAAAATPPAIDALLDLARGSSEMKGYAIELLGGARPSDPRVVTLLAEAVRSRVPAEAQAAARVLASAGTVEARDALLAALASSDESIASTAAGSLAKFRVTDEVAMALRNAMRSHPQLGGRVMGQLVSAGSPLGIELAKEAVRGEDLNEAYRALGALERASVPGALEVMVEATRARDPQLRAEAVSSLAGSGDKRAVDHVAAALRDSEPAVRAAAARSLGQLGTSQAREHLMTMTRSSNIDDRTAAVSNLRQFEDPESGRRLGELVRDPNPAVANAAIEAVVDRDDGLTTLRGFLGDRSAAYELRRQAAVQLSSRGYNDPAIDQLLEEADVEIFE